NRCGIRHLGSIAGRRARDRRRSIVHQPQRTTRHTDDPPPSARDLPISRVCIHWRPDGLRKHRFGYVPPARRLYRPNSQRREARRAADPAGDQSGARHQHEDRQGARPHRPAADDWPRRRGDRMIQRREFITLLGGASPLRNSRLAVIVFAASLIILWGNAAMTMTLKSPAFQQNGHIPSKYTCDGEDVSPPLAWEGAPNGAKSLVLIIDDPDAPDPKAPKMVWVHWVVYNMPPDTNSFPENAGKARSPQGASLGLNDFKKTGYGGPCPPIGRHRYFHKLYALDIMLDLRDATKSQIERAMRGHVLANAELIGTYQKGDR